MRRTIVLVVGAFVAVAASPAQTHPPVRKGQVVLDSLLARIDTPADLFAPGKRAIAVKVDLVESLKPGDRVDVTATIEQGQDRDSFTSVTLQDLKVLATAQESGEPASGAPQRARVATLEVTRDEAKRIAHAATEGRLQLLLRPLEVERGTRPAPKRNPRLP